MMTTNSSPVQMKAPYTRAFKAGLCDPAARAYAAPITPSANQSTSPARRRAKARRMFAMVFPSVMRSALDIAAAESMKTAKAGTDDARPAVPLETSARASDAGTA